MTQEPQQQPTPAPCTEEDIDLARARLERILSDPNSRPVEKIRASKLLAELNERSTPPDCLENDSHGNPAF